MADYYTDALTSSDFYALREMIGKVDYPWFYGKNHSLASLQYISAAAVFNRRCLGTLFNAIRLSETKELIGCVVLLPDIGNVKSTEIGYFIRPEYRGKGIVSEVAKQLVKKAIDDGWLETLYATTHPENIPSRRILEKLGLTCGVEFKTNKYMERDGTRPAKRVRYEAGRKEIESAISQKPAPQKPLVADTLNR